MDRYDHKRAHARRETAGEQTWSDVWNFVLDPSDGTFVTLHPAYKGTIFAMREGLPEPDHEAPNTGPGTSEGKGTYRYYKNAGVQTALRFDPNRVMPKGSGKGRGK